MLVAIVIILAVLWFLGYIHLPFFAIPDMVLFSLNGQPITLWNLLIFLVIAWAIGILPTPFREIGGVLLVLYVLSLLGILALPGLSSILVLAVIIGIIVSLIGL